MRIATTTALITLAGLFAIGCGQRGPNDPAGQPAPGPEPAAAQAADAAREGAPSALSVVLDVSGMTCAGCEQSIESNLLPVEGVESVEASHELGTVKIAYRPNMVDLAELGNAIAALGYTVEGRATEPKAEAAAEAEKEEGEQAGVDEETSS